MKSSNRTTFWSLFSLKTELKSFIHIHMISSTSSTDGRRIQWFEIEWANFVIHQTSLWIFLTFHSISFHFAINWFTVNIRRWNFNDKRAQRSKTYYWKHEIHITEVKTKLKFQKFQSKYSQLLNLFQFPHYIPKHIIDKFLRNQVTWKCEIIREKIKLVFNNHDKNEESKNKSFCAFMTS